MAAMVGKKLPGYALFMDVSHFERAAGAILPLRARHIGGLYGEIMVHMLNQNIMNLGLDGITYFIRAKGDVILRQNDVHVPEVFIQLGSGLSCVAPVAKELLCVLYAAYFRERHHLQHEEALELTLDGGDSYVNIMNYGDDNTIYGPDKKELHKCYHFLARYLPIAIEDPPAFLGYTYPPFQLRSSSYVLNLWEPERAPGSRFRPYPFYGMLERDKVYLEQTVTNEVRDLMMEQYHLLEDYGYTRKLIQQQAAREFRELESGDDLALNKNVLLGKEYLITEEEKLGSIRYVGLSEGRTAELMRILLKGSSLEKNMY
jgi:hypothetical protein